MHVMCALVVLAFLALRRVPLRDARSAARATRGWCRRPKFGLRNLFEVLADTVLGLMAGVMGEKAAKRYLPLVGTLFMFILFSNLLALIPGFLPPTDTLKTNLALSVLGVPAEPRLRRARARPQVLQALPRADLVADPADAADRAHQPHRAPGVACRCVSSATSSATTSWCWCSSASSPSLLPVPFMVMGVLVCVVQAVVFSLLTTVYISQAVAHEEH